MKKYLTVKDLKDILNEYPEELLVVSYRCGKSHYYPVIASHIEQITDAYFPDSDSELEQHDHFLIIAQDWIE